MTTNPTTNMANMRPQAGVALYQALLAGVARAPLNLGTAAPAPLQALLAAGPDEPRLWHTVAALDLWQRAGYAPPLAPLPAPPACAEDDAVCPRAAEQVLQMILRGIHPELLDSWLAQALALKLCLPPAALVPLLDIGQQKAALRPMLSALLGKRGRWLVAQHPRWSLSFGAGDAEGGTPDALWQLGNLAQRRAALAAMRRADPAAALATLERDWSGEPAENRIALLPGLSIGLGLDDEAFLERALDDKRKEVRKAAQQLLAALPGSQLGERCKARLAALFTLERKTGLGARLGAFLAGGAAAPPVRLSVRLPELCDKDMQRDGIGQSSHQGLGEKSGWLLDLMAGVAPAHWGSIWELSPRQVVDLLAGQEFQDALLGGLMLATGRAVRTGADPGASEWFLTLIEEVPAPRAGIGLLPDMAYLQPAQQERIVMAWLSAPGGPWQASAFDWAEQVAHYANARAGGGLSAELSRAMLKAARDNMLAQPQTSYLTRRQFSILAGVLDVGEIDYARAGWPAEQWEHWPLWRAQIDALMDTLHFRHTMQTSFLEIPA